MTIADQMGTTDVVELSRLLALANVAMSDAAIAIWESKFYYQLWRPVTAIREADSDGNDATVADAAFKPLGAPASNLLGPDFTPPFPTYPSGHAGIGGALFEILRRFYGTDDITFTFVSDEYNGETADGQGVIRPLIPRTFTSLSQAEEENGQSRIYLRDPLELRQDRRHRTGPEGRRLRFRERVSVIGKGQILHGRVLQGLTRFFMLPPSRQAQLSI